MIFETVTIGTATLIRGDCLAVLPTLPEHDLLLTDPPYLISASSGGIGGKRKYLTDIRGHIDAGFDVSMLAPFKNCPARV